MYTGFARNALFSQLTYRGQIGAKIAGLLVEVFAKVAIWMSIMGLSAQIDGITLNELITYAVFSGALIVWDWRLFIRRIGQHLTSGDVAVYLLKPIHYPLMLFAEECGSFAFAILIVFLPVLLVMSLSFNLAMPSSVLYLLLYLAYVVIGFIILFLLVAISGVVSFWMMTTFAMEWFLNSAMAIMSGTFIPIWFFPTGAAQVLYVLPFSWVGFHPMAVYLGKKTPVEAWSYLAFGLLWVVVLSLVLGLLWQQAAKRLEVQGG